MAVAMADTTYRLGTRASTLAVTQSTQVLEALSKEGVQCELVPMTSSADEDRITPLFNFKSKDQGLFTKHLEEALLDSKIDLAVHSLKDLPTTQPEELCVSCIPFRASTNDCIVTSKKAYLESSKWQIAPHSTVGTSSLRREALLLSEEPGLKIVSVRGNVPRRIEAVVNGKVDAVVVARAGLDRLGLALNGLIKIDLPDDFFIPAPGQGALAVETREDLKGPLREALLLLNNVKFEIETRVERKILRLLEGGCSLPLGVRCMLLESGELSVRAFLGVLSDSNSKERKWKGFHRFQIEDKDEKLIVNETVEYFRKVKA